MSPPSHRPSASPSTCPTTTRSTPGRCATPSPRRFGERVGRFAKGLTSLSCWAVRLARRRADQGSGSPAASRSRAESVVVANGVWAGELAGVPIRPVKGQILRLRDPGGPGLVDRVVRLAESYVVPRGDGRYVVGATVEEHGFDTALTAGGVFEVLRDASEVLPGLLELEIEEAAVGLRPATPDNGPLLGRATKDGPILAAGHFRNGILLAPITADAIAAILAGKEPPPEVEPFTADRFDSDRPSNAQRPTPKAQAL